MTIKLQAVNAFVIVKRDDAEAEIGGLLLPDQAQVKPAQGEILSVGQMVLDTEIKVGKKAFWNKQMGWEMEVDGEAVTVLLALPDNSHILAVV